MKKNASTYANEVVDRINVEKINQHLVSLEESLTSNDYLDWMIQRKVTNNLLFTSYPDGKIHTFQEGLKQVFETQQKYYSCIQEMKRVYNYEIYHLAYRIAELENLLENQNEVDFKLSHDKLMKIIEIINS